MCESFSRLSTRVGLTVSLSAATTVKMSTLVLLATALAALAYYIYYKLSSIHSYWERKGVKGPKPEFFYGNLKPVMQKKHNIDSMIYELYQQYPNEKVVGLYQGYVPTLLLRDPQLVKTVLIREFSSFVDRGVKQSREPIFNHLFAAEGDDWKSLRQKISPIFTTGKLKNMMPLLNRCVEQYMQYLDKVVAEDGHRELRSLSMKYTMKTITTVAFGIDVDCYIEDITDFEKTANKTLTLSGRRRLAFILNNVWPGLIDMLHINVAPEVSQFFLSLVKNIIAEREGKPKVRKDFMDLLIEMKEQGKITRVKDEGVAELDITDELIAAQAFVFYIAGFETSSGTMSFLLYELAKHPSIQERCYREICQVMEKHGGQLTYDSLKELEYLSMVFDETLRMYPIVGVLLRKCMNDFTFKELNLTIKKGTKVMIPVKNLHREYSPDPDKFDPERFAPGKKEPIHDVYMPFGDGPRNCIGLRFAKEQSLLGMAHFLRNFRVSTYEKTPTKLVIDPTQVTLTHKDGIWLNIEKRKV